MCLRDRGTFSKAARGILELRVEESEVTESDVDESEVKTSEA